MQGTTLNILFSSAPSLAQAMLFFFSPDVPCKTTQVAVHPYELVPEAETGTM